MASDAENAALLMACMADLGRERQEELPLSDVARGGPTFAPGRGTGVGHILPSLKENLSKGWGARIVDGESKQMEGLECEDSRPWAKQVAPVSSRKPSAPLPSGKGDRTKSENQPKPKASQKLIKGSAAQNRQFKLIAETQKKALAAQLLRPSDGKLKPAKTATSSLGQSRICPSASSAGDSAGAQSSSQIPPAVVRQSPNSSQEHTLYQGQCQVLTGVNDNSAFSAQLALQVNLERNCGILVLTAPPRNPRSHDVLDLAPPVVSGRICIVACQHERDAFRYRIKFATTSEAGTFQHYLRSLQDSAAQESKVSPVSEALASSTTNRPVARHDERPGVSSSRDLDARSECTSENTLIDIGDSTSSSTLRHPFRDMASNLLNLIQRFFVSMLNNGSAISTSTVRDAENLVFENWREAGLDNGEIGEDFQQILRSMVNITLKTDVLVNERASAQTATMSDLREVNEPQEKASRITYSAAELLRYRPGPVAASATNAAQPSGRPKVKGKGLASSRWAIYSDDLQASSESVETQPLKSDSTQVNENQNVVKADPTSPSKPQGLRASGWADKS